MQKDRHAKLRLATICAYAFLGVMVILYVVPILWAFLSTFKQNKDIINNGFTLIPQSWTLENYIKVISNTTNAPIVKWFINSLIISCSHTALMLLVSSMAAFGYQRMKFRYRDNLFIALMLISMIPGIVNIIPTYVIVDYLGWVDTPLACIIPGLSNVGNIFLLRQFLYGIPKEMDEAAVIDGASSWQIYTKIILPGMKPILTVVALFTFTGSWNDFLWPSIVFNDVSNMTISAGLKLFQGMYDQHSAGTMLAGAIVAMIPTFVIYLFAQKHFIATMSFNAAVKG